MRNKPRCGLFTCALTILGATVITTTLLLHNYVEKQYHAMRGPASRQAALRDARDAAAALVDAVTRPPTPEGAAENRQLEIVRGAGNATRHLHRFSELGGDRHLRGPMRQRVVSDTMHHRLVRQAHASLQAPTNAIKFMEANCSTQEACRERFRYPDHHAVECSNATRGFEYLVDLRCGHPCEKAFFHRIESCMQPMYALLRLARTTRGAAALVERSGWLSGGLEEVFWTELEPVSELLRYDDRSRGVTQWDGCWDRTGAPLPLICFNVDASAKVLVPGRASQEAPPTEASLLLHADLLRLGLYPQEPRRPLSPVVIAVQRHESRSFLNFSGLIAELSTQFRGSILTYHGNESLRETIELFGRASVVFGYHGAGFTNMLFSRPGTTAIEIFTRPCRHDYPGFNFRTVAVTGGNWRVLNVGTPFDRDGQEVRRASESCKPPLVAWGAQDLRELRDVLGEELSRR